MHKLYGNKINFSSFQKNTYQFQCKVCLDSFYILLFFFLTLLFVFTEKRKRVLFHTGGGWGSWWSVHVYPFDRLKWLQSLNVFYKSKLILCTLKLPTIIIVFSTRRAYVKIYRITFINDNWSIQFFWKGDSDIKQPF